MPGWTGMDRDNTTAKERVVCSRADTVVWPSVSSVHAKRNVFEAYNSRRVGESKSQSWASTTIKKVGVEAKSSIKPKKNALLQTEGSVLRI